MSEEVYEEKEFIEFKIGDRLFRYEYGNITIEQAETANMISEFAVKASQRENASLTEYMNSGYKDWKYTCLAHLVNEIKDEKILDYDQGKTKELIALFKSAKGIQTEMEAIIKDFFTCTGRGSTALWLLYGIERIAKAQILFNSAGTVLNGLRNKRNDMTKSGK